MNPLTLILTGLTLLGVSQSKPTGPNSLEPRSEEVSKYHWQFVAWSDNSCGNNGGFGSLQDGKGSLSCFNLEEAYPKSLHLPSSNAKGKIIYFPTKGCHFSNLNGYYHYPLNAGKCVDFGIQNHTYIDIKSYKIEVSGD